MFNAAGCGALVGAVAGRARAVHRRQILTLGAAALASGCASRARSLTTGPTLAFPGAVGWAASTAGGRGGRILRVTTLASDGPGSLREALTAPGPRIVVFEVGGVIDLAMRTITVREPFLTLAGQTAPSPGVTLIKGGLIIRTHDVVVRHIAVRPGEAGQAKGSGWEVDGIACDRAHDVIVDHCSCTWATDENLSASGPRFDGPDLAAWRQATSRRITFSNNIVAEGLSNSTHSKGEHSKGTLIHDNCCDVLIVGNLYANNRERNPLVKGGAGAVVANNLIWNPGKRTTHYNLHPAEWEGHPHVAGDLVQVGNVVLAGPSTEPDVALTMLGGVGRVTLHQRDNVALLADGSAMPRLSYFGRDTPRVEATVAQRPPLWPEGFAAQAAEDVEGAVLRTAGARPWDRDPVDRRIVADVQARRGTIIDSEAEVGGYPTPEPTHLPFRDHDWNLDTLEVRGRRLG